MFNVYKNQLSRQTGSRNLTGPKNATHNMVYLYDACDQISNFCHQVIEKNATKNILDGRTDRGKTVYPPLHSGSGGIIIKKGALDSQPQVIKFISCLPMVGGSLRVLPPLKLVAMI